LRGSKLDYLRVGLDTHWRQCASHRVRVHAMVQTQAPAEIEAVAVCPPDCAFIGCMSVHAAAGPSPWIPWLAGICPCRSGWSHPYPEAPGSFKRK